MTKPTEAVSTYEYQGSPVQFEVRPDGRVMANATSMCAPFGVLVKDWLRLKSTKRLVEAYESLHNQKTQSEIEKSQKEKKPFDTSQENGGIFIEDESIFLDDEDEEIESINPSGETFVETVRGGDAPGTWIHECLVLDLAQWLDVKFRIWCNERLSELLRTGRTQVVPDSELNGSELIARAVVEAQKVLALRERRIQEQQQVIVLQERSLKEAAPKVEYHDTVLAADGDIISSVIAKELGMGAPSLHKRLQEKGVIYKRDDVWMLKHKYQDKGYHKYRTHSYTGSDGKTRTSHTLTWTEKGRKFIHSLLG